jgi:nitrite reductase (NADH) large subunit
VIGGGLLGLEAANGLSRRGMDVTVVHLESSLMERQLDPAAADLLKASLEARGLKFLMGARTSAIAGEERATGLKFQDGSTLDADLIVMTAGVRPNIDLARQAGLHCERGVLVTDTMQTYDPSIYAVGECVQHRNTTFGLVAPLWDQARVCAAHLAEQGFSRFKGSIVATHLKVTGIELYSAGQFLGSEGDETIVLQDEKRGVYKRIVIRDNRVLGTVLYGDAADGGWYFDLMAAQQDIGPLRDKLLFGPAFAAVE